MKIMSKTVLQTLRLLGKPAQGDMTLQKRPGRRTLSALPSVLCSALMLLAVSSSCVKADDYPRWKLYSGYLDSSEATVTSEATGGAVAGMLGSVIAGDSLFVASYVGGAGLFAGAQPNPSSTSATGSYDWAQWVSVGWSGYVDDPSWMKGGFTVAWTKADIAGGAANAEDYGDSASASVYSGVSWNPTTFFSVHAPTTLDGADCYNYTDSWYTETIDDFYYYDDELLSIWSGYVSDLYSKVGIAPDPNSSINIYSSAEAGGRNYFRHTVYTVTEASVERFSPEDFYEEFPFYHAVSVSGNNTAAIGTVGNISCELFQ